MHHSKDRLKKALQTENSKFTLFYDWLNKHMSPKFFEKMTSEDLVSITHSLMELPLHKYFSHIRVKGQIFAFCLDGPDTDLAILQEHGAESIKNYQTFVSDASFPGTSKSLRIAVLTIVRTENEMHEPFSRTEKDEIRQKLIERDRKIGKSEFDSLYALLHPGFVKFLSKERCVLALDALYRAKTGDECQYEALYRESSEDDSVPSLRIVFARKGVSKYNFLYELAKMFARHKLSLKRVSATYVNPSDFESILVMSIGVEGAERKETDLDDLLAELCTLGSFEYLGEIENTFVDSGLVRGNIGNLIKSTASFIHQNLVHCDPYRYSLEYVTEGLCRYPEITVALTEAFEQKFHPIRFNLTEYQKKTKEIENLIKEIDTGNEPNDTRRKNILKQALHFIDHTLKTNFYRISKVSLCFRLDPSYLHKIPSDISDKFPVLPYAIFFMKGFYFVGFHIRFKDLARGGLRTVFLENKEAVSSEKNGVFLECYGLALRQEKKNKDIPEGGAKGVIFLEPLHHFEEEKKILRDELFSSGCEEKEIEKTIKKFSSAQKACRLHGAQRAYVESLLTLINCRVDGSLKATRVVDYLKKPEYIYLGPDENMHNEMIEWIANYSVQAGYRPGSAFISGKPGLGINHKEFGVTSLGVNVWMEETLRYLGIDPLKDPFKVKMTGGPDGDVAGNQMLNLLSRYPNTAKLLTTIDISGVILDPSGLNLKTLADLFHKNLSVKHYPAEELSDGGFILDLTMKKENKPYDSLTLCRNKEQGKLKESELSNNKVSHLLRDAINKTEADVFIPGGGRPGTLNEGNVAEFLNGAGEPTARIIVEGANLYLTQGARRFLEKLGVLVIKDSSANKGGVICSSFEVVASLCLTDEEFFAEKPPLIKEILFIIESKAKKEALLLLKTYTETGKFLTDISEEISDKINTYTYEILERLEPIDLPSDPTDPLILTLLSYLPPLLRTKYPEKVLSGLPEIHKKAIIACHLASCHVYDKGLDHPLKMADILPGTPRREITTS